MVRGVFVVTLALGLAACKQRDDAGPMPQPTRAPPAGFEDVDTTARPERRAPPIERPEGSVSLRGKAKATARQSPFTRGDVAELRRLLPALEAEELTPLAVVPRSRVIRGRLCAAEVDAGSAAADLTARLRRGGWQEVGSRQGRRGAERRTVSARRDRFRLNVIAQASADEDCAGATLAVTVHERPPPRPVPSGDAGAVR